MAICKKCKSSFKKVSKYFDEMLVKNVDAAIHITTKIKEFLNSDTVLTLVNITPIEWDNTLRRKAVEGLNYALSTLRFISDRTLKNDDLELLKAYLQGKLEHNVDSSLQKIASLTAAYIDGRHKQHIYDTATQVSYSLSKENN